MIRQLSLLCAILILILGCGGAKSLDYLLELEETRTWPASDIDFIEATTVNGNISVEAAQGANIIADITRKCLGEDSADAASHIDNIVITEEVASGVLMLEADMPDTNEYNYVANFDFRTPDTVSLELNIENGDASITNMTEGANFTIVNGNFTSQNMQGGIDGEITNGSTDCDLSALAASESAILTAVNGNVTLALPVNVSVNFDAQTENGTVTVTGFANVNYTIDEPDHKVGTIGSGLAPVVITVTNGNIIIKAR